MTEIQAAARDAGLTALVVLALFATFTAGYCAWPLTVGLRGRIAARWQVIRFRRHRRQRERAAFRLAKLERDALDRERDRRTA